LSRYAVTALVLVLLGGTAVALGIIEGFKLEKNPISGPSIDKSFSPVCRCPQDVANIRFKLRNTGRLTLEVIGPDGNVVRTLARNRKFFHGEKHFVWNGRNDSGQRVPDGVYKLRLHFGGQHRTIVLPRGTIVDTRPPRVTLVSVVPRVFSPDGDHIRDSVSVRYRVSEQAHVRVMVDGNVAVRGRTIKLAATLNWPGTVHGATVPAGVHRITLVAQDLAGNLSRPSSSRLVQIRYVALALKTIRAIRGQPFSVRVLTDARTIHWQFQGRSGTARPKALTLTATKVGRYALYVSANGHSARAVVVVAKR